MIQRYSNAAERLHSKVNCCLLLKQEYWNALHYVHQRAQLVSVAILCSVSKWAFLLHVQRGGMAYNSQDRGTYGRGGEASSLLQTVLFKTIEQSWFCITPWKEWLHIAYATQFPPFVFMQLVIAFAKKGGEYFWTMLTDQDDTPSFLQLTSIQCLYMTNSPWGYEGRMLEQWKKDLSPYCVIAYLKSYLTTLYGCHDDAAYSINCTEATLHESMAVKCLLYNLKLI